MKRIAILVAMVGLLLAGVGPTTGAAVETAAPPTPNCGHYSGGGNDAIVDGGAKYVRLNGTGAPIGSVQLCHRGSYYWAYVVFYDYMPSGKWGNAVLEIIRGGVKYQWSCDSHPQGPPNGGNRRVLPGQNRCWTPKQYADITSDWIRVIGYRTNGGAWDAWGYGAWV
jgi:hypothetical protein